MTDVLVTYNETLKEQYPTDEDWIEIEVTITILVELVAEATNLLSASRVGCRNISAYQIAEILAEIPNQILDFSNGLKFR
ncbi:hypothetical protein RclHR1_00250022 [Rhizophagus clarus]|uniref:Uncharacterized protein n=1 Tax=Rhizophagus clarus TaxID=94130 RepID=A0A2Z6RBC7_9GLOM|nr:hypothetical protein RclHR1_00250022 [Rhizophagus clarus]